MTTAIWLVHAWLATTPAPTVRTASTDRVELKDGGSSPITLKPDACAPASREQVAAMVEGKECGWSVQVEQALSSQLTSKTIGADLLQALGQVVLDKAAQAGWDLLARRMRELACGSEAPAPAPATCKLLTDLPRLQDLLAQPELLIRAVLGDWYDMTVGTTAPAFTGDVLAGLSPVRLFDAWRLNGARGLQSAAVVGVGAAIRAAAARATCEAPSATMPRTEAALWALGRWLVIRPRYPVETVLAACSTLSEEEQARVAGLITANLGIFDLDQDEMSARPALHRASDAINLVFELAALDLPGHKDELRDLKEVAIGVLEGDWTRVTAAAVRRLAARFPAAGVGASVATADMRSGACAPATPEERARAHSLRMLLDLLAGAARYAASYAITDPAKASEARKDAIADLVSRMASRRERTYGAVWSLGGSLQLGAGCRGSFATAGMYAEPCATGAWATPVRLALGFAVDTYHPWRGAAAGMGFHAEMTVFDLGQYVVFEDRTLTLTTPKVTAALSPGLTAGWRLGARATPVFLGAFGAFTPFVRTAADQMTFTLGGMIGVYIPFVDFN